MRKNGDIYGPLSNKTSYGREKSYFWRNVGWGLLGLMILAAFALSIAAIVKALHPNTCPVDQQKQNVYVFGISFEDWGNWVSYYEGHGYTLNTQGVITPGSALYFDSVYGQAPPVQSTDIVNEQGRFSNGRNGVDFIADHYRMTKLVSSKIDHIPSDRRGYMINFAVGGSTADGNVHNIPSVSLPHNYIQVAGAHGFNSQVTDFLAKLAANKNAIVHAEDIFFYSSIGSNDISLIAACPNVTACILNFTYTHLTNIKTLYDAGMRRMILTYADDVFGYNPATIKANTTGYYITLFNGISDTIFTTPNTGFLALLYAKLVDLSADGMSDLDLNVIPLSTLISGVSANPQRHGIRKTLTNDRDPRNYPLGTTPSLFPFPTLYDTQVSRGAVLLDAYYNDDNHPTEQGYHDYAQAFIDALSTMFTVCNPVV